MSIKYLLILTLIGTFVSNNYPVFAKEQLNKKNPIENSSCYPSVDVKQNQYIIGYGSLINRESRDKTSRNIGLALPIVVEGWERGWFINSGYSNNDNTTFLAVISNRSKKFNAVIYQVFKHQDILGTDRREKMYCRSYINPEQVTMLENSGVPKGQIWMYTISSQKISNPSLDAPIVQSYVDIVMNGCLEIEAKFEIINFAKMCVETTSNWSNYWVNDRLYPRRPFSKEPKALKIDAILQETLPDYFPFRKIE